VVRARTGKRGVDVVIDNVGKASWAQSLGALGKMGRLVTCGATSGPLVETDLRRMFWNQWTLMGSTMGSDAEFAAIVAELRAGRLLPPVDSVHPLEEGRAALARLQSGEQFGKVVLRVARRDP
jgi:NADPH:quinone reductase-like Zn-dependent oxidoreductase